MPICQGCGSSFDDQFKFCPQCGRAKPEPLKIQVQVNLEDKWETCRITWREYKAGDIHHSYRTGFCEFFANALGANDSYLAGDSPLYQVSSGLTSKDEFDGTRPCHDFLLKYLARDGWEDPNQMNLWWDIQLRRRLKADNPKPWKVWVVGHTGGLKQHHFCLMRTGRESRDYFQYVGESAGFKKGFFEYELDETPERRQIFEEFKQQVIADGYQPVDPEDNESLKLAFNHGTGGSMHFTSLFTTNMWAYQVFLKR